MVINMEYKDFSAKTVDDCITDACTEFGVPSDRLDYEVVNEGSAGFMGIGSKPAVIKARIKEDNSSVSETEVKKEIKKEAKVEKKEAKAEAKIEKKEAKVEVKAEKKADDHAPKAKNIPDEVIEGMKKEASEFLTKVFAAMDLKVTSTFDYNKEDNTLNINLDGDTMGVLIGKRGQTLDSLQYLVSLVINKGTAEYVRVKVDTENYRARRKDTLENLAKNISFKVKRTRRSVSLEPMNPYERRIIHSALQNDKYVTTHSEGEEPFRKVVVTLKK